VTLNRRAGAVAAAALIAAVVSACGGSSSGDSTAPAGSVPSQPANALHVTIGDGSLQVEGTPRPGRIDITVVNQSSESAEFSFQPLKAGVTVSQVETALRRHGEAAANKLLSGDSDRAGYGEPAIVAPGDTEESVTTTVVPTGDYVAGSFLPSGEGGPQATHGVLSGFTIAGATYTAVPGDVAGTIELSDHSITLPPGFTGAGTYAVADSGKRRHSLSFGLLKKGTTLMAMFQCVGSSFGQNRTIDHCPGKLVGGIDSIKPGGTAYVTMQLAVGRYGYLSTDGNDVRAGLMGTVTVS
jgi:hypothetical protein